MPATMQRRWWAGFLLLFFFLFFFLRMGIERIQRDKSEKTSGSRKHGGIKIDPQCIRMRDARHVRDINMRTHVSANMLKTERKRSSNGFKVEDLVFLPRHNRIFKLKYWENLIHLIIILIFFYFTFCLKYKTTSTEASIFIRSILNIYKMSYCCANVG